MQWKVYYHNFNRNRIDPYDLFVHGKFPEYIRKHIEKCKTKEEFADKVKSELMYYFWSKCEWEVLLVRENDRIIIKPWIGCREDISLDVTDAEDFDWVTFYEKAAKRRVVRDGAVKIDVYDQVMFRFNDFVDYCWNHRKGRVANGDRNR